MSGWMSICVPFRTGLLLALGLPLAVLPITQGRVTPFTRVPNGAPLSTKEICFGSNGAGNSEIYATRNDVTKQLRLKNRSHVFSLLFGRLTRLMITTASSAGSTGLATCIWKPALRARIRSSTRP